MNGAKGSALEWALALLRAPAERHLLRQRPLPQEGMEQLLGIAAEAMPGVLAEQARRFGEAEAQVVEAARFYAREVLFHPQADAYRILGVEPRASADTIKAHYRLLQRWLHPDRACSEDDVVFAVRVNGAWNRLRSPERRRAYDEALRAARPPEIFDSNEAMRSVRTWVPAVEPVAPVSPWRRRWPVLALLMLCGVLALLALRDRDRADAAWEVPQGSADAVRAGDPDPLAPLLPAAGLGSTPSNRPALPPREAALGDPEPSATQSQRPGSGPAVGGPKAPTQFPLPSATRYPARESAGGEAQRRSSAVAIQPAAAADRLRDDPESPHQPAPAQRPATAATSRAPATAEASPPSSPEAQPEFARVQAARLAGEALLDYLRNPRRPTPPIWISPAVEADAQRLRQQLHAEGRLRLAEAHWRIGGNRAVFQSAVVVAGTPARSGLLTTHLRWRDGYWLVSGMEMESIR